MSGVDSFLAPWSGCLGHELTDCWIHAMAFPDVPAHDPELLWEVGLEFAHSTPLFLQYGSQEGGCGLRTSSRSVAPERHHFISGAEFSPVGTAIGSPLLRYRLFGGEDLPCALWLTFETHSLVVGVADIDTQDGIQRVNSWSEDLHCWSAEQFESLLGSCPIECVRDVRAG